MDINQLSKKIENKLLKDTSIKDVKIIDNTYKHLKHNSHQKGKFHIKLEINSDILKNKSTVTFCLFDTVSNALLILCTCSFIISIS